MIKMYLYALVMLVIMFVANTAIADNKNGASLTSHSTKYVMKAGDAHIVRRVLGPISDSIYGVPAAPVDSLDWSGSEIKSIKGKAHFVIDPINNTGEIHAKWTDQYGDWTYHQTMFAPPPHPTGVRIGTSISTTTKIQGDPITTNVFLHGDTGAGDPFLPTFFNVLATWGPSKITLNGIAFENPYDGTGPMWEGHTMLSDGVRDNAGAVRTVSGAIYSPIKSAEGVSYPDDLVFHLEFHTLPGPVVADNIPPSMSFFYHITFNKVKFKIKHGK